VGCAKRMGVIIESATSDKFMNPFKDVMENFVFYAQEALETQQSRFKVCVVLVSFSLVFTAPRFLAHYSAEH
jgi:uncharacterized membrane protein